MHDYPTALSAQQGQMSREIFFIIIIIITFRNGLPLPKSEWADEAVAGRFVCNFLGPARAILIWWKKTEKLLEEPIPWHLRPSGTARNRGEIFKTFEVFMLLPGNTVILLYDGGKRVATKARRGCQVCI